MKISLNVLTLFTALVMLVASQPSLANKMVSEQWLSNHPSATEIEPGLYLLPSDDGSKVYGFGVRGMEYVVTQLDRIIESGDLAKDDQKAAMASRDALMDSIQAHYAKSDDRATVQSRGDRGSTANPLANDSGTICQTVHYDLTANAYRSGFWYVLSDATAGFKQWGGGPPSPYLYATLHTYASASGNGLTQAQYDTQYLLVNGFDYVSANPSFAGAGPSGSCMEAEALSYVHVPDCPGTNFKSVSESFDLYCD